MFCSIYKWFISQAMDSGKPISEPLGRHLRRCASCREFAQLCESLNHKFIQDKPDFTEDYNEALNEKIRSAWDRRPKPRSVSARKPALVPVLVSAFVVLAISISIFFLTAPHSSKSTPMNQLFEYDIAKTSLENMLGKVESPLELEILGMKQTMMSTTEFLLSCIDINLGQKAE